MKAEFERLRDSVIKAFSEYANAYIEYELSNDDLTLKNRINNKWAEYQNALSDFHAYTPNATV